jgi:hypothetical protein
MPYTDADYLRLQSFSEQGTFPAVGFKSQFLFIQHFSVLDFNVHATVDTTFNIYTSPTQTETDRILYFSKTIPANTTFHRHYDIPPQHIQIELTNTTSTEGMFIINSHCSLVTQFNASTFLNSKIKVDANTSLTRVANDFNVDMVRELHDDFKKVNILGITDHQQALEYTLGVNTYDVFNIGQTPVALYLQNNSTNDTTAGTGARSVKIFYVDSNYDEQTVVFAMPATTGLHAVGVTGLAVHRVEVVSSGTLFKNDAGIFITNSVGSDLLAHIPPGANLSHGCYFLVPRNKQLILTDINISAIGFPATIRVYEYDLGSSRIRASIGDFRLSTNYSQLVYKLNGLVDAQKMIMVNIVPDAGAPTTQTLVNININGVLCPLINSF